MRSYHSVLSGELCLQGRTRPRPTGRSADHVDNMGTFVPCMRGRTAGGLTRKAKSKVAATYPDLAKRMSVIARVRIQVLVALNGRHDSR